VELGIFRAYDAGFNQPADVGVIAGEAGNINSANVVEAAVAHMSEVEFVADDGESGAGGAHSIKFGMIDGIALNTAVSGGKDFEQSSLRIGAKGVIVGVTDGLYGELAGFVAAVITAHAIGDDGETAFETELVV
jgi:hypothetical protein